MISMKNTFKMIAISKIFLYFGLNYLFFIFLIDTPRENGILTNKRLLNHVLLHFILNIIISNILFEI